MLEKLKTKHKIQVIEVVLILGWLAIFKIRFLPDWVGQAIKIFYIVINVSYLIKKGKIRQITKVNKFLLLYCFWSLFTTFLACVSEFVSWRDLINSIVNNSIFILEATIIEICYQKSMGNKVIKTLLYVMGMYAVLSIISILILGVSDKIEIMYFFGGKFLTSYYLSAFLILYIIYNKDKIKKETKKKILVILMTVVILLIEYYIKCSTVVVASLVLLLLLLKKESLIRILKKRAVIIALICLCACIPFFIKNILEIPLIKHIIVDILHENLVLTGRTKIYRYVGEIICNRICVGYGYGNNIVEQIVGFGNAQNGALHMIVEKGIIGFGLFITLIFSMLKQKNVKKGSYEYQKEVWPLYVFIIFMIVCSIVEISYNYLFFTFLLLIYNHNKYMKKENELNVKDEQSSIQD